MALHSELRDNEPVVISVMLKAVKAAMKPLSPTDEEYLILLDCEETLNEVLNDVRFEADRKAIEFEHE